MSDTSITRLFGILDLLVGRGEGVDLKEIAAGLGIAKSSAHRLLMQLQSVGYVRQDSETTRFLLAAKPISMVFKHLAGLGVTDLAQPILDRLARQSGELARLGVIDGETQIWVAKAQGARSGLKYDPEMGEVVQLTSTASGQAWLACLAEDEALRLAQQQGFGNPAEIGPNAPQSIPALLNRLSEVRAKGYAMVQDSSALGTAALAAAIHHPVKDRVIGILVIAGPTLRLTEARMTLLVPDLLAAARELAVASLGSHYLSGSAGRSYFGKTR